VLFFNSFWINFAAAELPALLLLAAVLITRRKAPFEWKRLLVYGLAVLQLALPALILLSALLFSHDRPIIGLSAASRLSYLPFALYLLQFPLALTIAVFLGSRFDKMKHRVIIAYLVVFLLAVQAFFSFYVTLLTSLAIAGDSF